MARKVAGVAVLLLLALLLSPSADARSTRIECAHYPAKNPSCGPGYTIDETCGKQCKSEGYHLWICFSTCTCLSCPSLDLENRLEREKIQKQAAGNKDAPAGADGSV